MNSTIEINGKKLLTIKEVSSKISYSRDYITRLARDRKIVATQIGRIWYVDIDSVKNYQKVGNHEQEIKKRLLSDQRKRDLGIKSAKAALQKKRTVNHKSSSLAVAGFTSLVVTLGVMSGVWMTSDTNRFTNNIEQIASAKQSIYLSDDSVQVYVSDGNVVTTESKNYQVKAMYDFAPAEFSEVEAGYVLLPQSGSQTIEEYFSDPVTTLVKENGETVLVKVDEEGNPHGNEIPFISVPVNHLTE